MPAEGWNKPKKGHLLLLGILKMIEFSISLGMVNLAKESSRLSRSCSSLRQGYGLASQLRRNSKRELCVVKDLGDLLNCIPITGRGRDAEKLLNLAEVADRFHLPTIDTEDESVFDRDDLE